LLNPLGLLALATLPAIAFLHLWRRRYRPRPVSALFLWELAGRVPAAGRRRERLRTGASFWLELAAALALALALAGPRACGGLEAEHLVLVLDDSASMLAGPANGTATGRDGSAHERAVRFATERLAALPRRSRVSIIATGTPPRLVAGPAAPVPEASKRLERWRPRAAHHDVRPALALALSVAGGSAVTFVTDHYRPDEVPPEVELVALGRPLANAAVAHAARTRSDRAEDEDDVFVVVRSYAPEPLATTLTVSADGVALHERPLELAPGARRELSFSVPRAIEALALELEPDALALDDRAVLLPEPPRTLALATTLAAEDARRLGLSSRAGDEPAIDRWLALVPDSIAAPSLELAHLVIGSDVPSTPAAWTLELRAPGGERRDLVGPFLTEKHHPLLRGLTLEGIVWSLDPDLVLDGAPLVSAGDQPILCETVERGARRLVMNVDPARSSLWRSPDWPIFLANWAAERRRELPGPERTNLAVGEPFVYRGRGPASYRLVGPIDGEEPETLELAARETLFVEGLDRPGVWSLREGERELCRVALRFEDAAESDLRDRGSGRRPAQADRASVAAEFRWIDALCVLAALACLILDWTVLARGAAVGGAS